MSNSKSARSRQSLTQAELKSALDYDPETGIFTSKFTGKSVGSVNHKSKRVMIKVKGLLHSANRLAYLWMMGEMPRFQIGYIDGDYSNNKWANFKTIAYSDRDFYFEEARACFNYDPSSGIMTWAKTLNQFKIGDVVGSVHVQKSGRRYRIMSFKGRSYQQHQFIYGWMTGNLPPEGFEIDHEDRDGLNNKWNNLRLCTRSQNNANRKLNNNKHGFRGVHAYTKASKTKYRAIVYADGNKYSKCGFETPEAAHEAYKHMAAKFHGEFAGFE